MHTVNSRSILAAGVLIVLTASHAIAAEERSPPARAGQSRRVPVTISKETTYLTAPLRPDGWVDYVAALDARCREGVTPENNAAVLFWKAIGPSDISAKKRKEFFKRLGVAPMPERGAFVSWFSFIDRLQETGQLPPHPPDGNSPDRTWEQIHEAASRPWLASQYRESVQWLAINESALALIAEASKRPRYYSPLVSEDATLVGAFEVWGMSPARDAARALAARAMLRVAEGRVDDAWQDLLSCHRLARLFGQRPYAVDVLVSMALDGVACEGDIALMRETRLTASRALEMRRDLAKLPPTARMVDAWNFSERFLCLDCLAAAARGNTKQVSYLLDLDWERPQDRKPIWEAAAQGAFDWDAIFRQTNSDYDRIVEAARKPTWPQRKAALHPFDDEVRTQAEAAEKRIRAAIAGPAKPPQIDTQDLGWFLRGRFLLPSAAKMLDAEERWQMRLDLVQLAFALAAYRADVGHYPANLSEAAPKYIERIPQDRFIDGPLHYRRNDDGYILYSVGPNGKDDGGRGIDERTAADQDWDDLVIRIPAPKTVKPR